MNSRRLAGVGAIVLVAVALGAWLLLRRPAAPDQLELQGNVDIRQVWLAFDGSGRVLDMYVQEGDAVKLGQLLARLDTRTLDLQAQQVDARIEAQRQSTLLLRAGARPQELAQARARVAAAEAEANRARDEAARLQELASRTAGRATSAQELEASRTAVRTSEARVVELREALRVMQLGARSEEIDASEAQLRGLQAELALLRHQIAQAELHAPVSGVVRSRLLEPGDLASPQKAAYTLALTDPKWVRVYVNERDLGSVRPGMPAQVVTDGQPQRPIAGTVGFISSVAEFTPKSVQTPEVRTALVYEVRVRVDDPANVLRLGQPATVRLDLRSAGPAR